MKRLRSLLPLVVCAFALTGQEIEPTTFSGYYWPVAVGVSPSVPPYKLPLDLKAVANWNQVAQSGFPLARIEALVARNGFGVLASASGEDIISLYDRLKQLGIPAFITADTLLHLYHVQFDETLREVEEREFHPVLVKLTRALMEDAARSYARLEGDAKEAARRNLAYFAVALKLLDPDAATPGEAGALVERELALIQAHAGFSASPIFVYREDYSQYQPRGHYTRSQKLERYFRGMMWYGRMAFLLKNSDLLPPPNAEIQTLGAAQIAEALARVDPWPWSRIYSVTAFYVGLADDLSPQEYLQGLRAVLGTASNLAALSEPAKFQALRAHLAALPNPRIYGGTGDCQVGAPYDPGQIDECLEASKGMRFMGQRFVPDSYIFQNLVGMDYLGKGKPFTMVQSMGGPIRGFPRGLDAMDLLGSARARAILTAEGDTEYLLFEKQRQKLVDEFGAFSSKDWNRNLYWGWLYTLKPLLAPCGAGYPTFMQTEAWTDRSLDTALASWTELRHDTILYAKQSYTPVRSSLPPEARGWVEPAPEFYARLLALTRMTRHGLEDVEAIDAAAGQRLVRLEEILERLLDLSIKQLAGQTLSREEYAYIRDIGAALERTVVGVDDVGLKTTLVADVHTDANTGQVLEEGVGYVDTLVVVVPQPDGTLSLALGPAMSYYEFKWPMSDRLTDEAWREVLAKQPPARPAWTASFVR